MTDKRSSAVLRWGLRSLLLGLVAVAPAAAASSAMATPTGEFANFAQCPLENPVAKGCLYAVTTSGEFKVGSTAVPLEKPVTLQGGLTLEKEKVTEVVPAADGETLSKTPEVVPGGLLKIVAPSFLPGFLQSIFNEFINEGPTGVTETTELVGTARLDAAAVLSGVGTGLELPTRVHLENLFLGSECYIGSAQHPVVVDLTTGTTSPPPPNSPITGSRGGFGIGGGGAIIRIEKNSLVNNSFSAPEAEGCGGILSFLIDPAVDAEVGLPSAAGNNTAILNGSQEIASAESVRAH